VSIAGYEVAGVSLAIGAHPKYFQQVVVNLERGVSGQRRGQFFHRAEGEGNSLAASGAHQMMPMTGRSPDIHRAAVLLDKSSQDIDGCQDFERAINRGPPNPVFAGPGDFGHQVLCRKRPRLLQNHVYNLCPGLREAIAVLHQQGIDIGAVEALLSGDGGDVSDGTHASDATTGNITSGLDV
jgi:hypothetical protein